VLGDKVLGLFLGLEILGDPFPGLGFGRRDLNALAFGMLVVTWRHVFYLSLPQKPVQKGRFGNFCPELRHLK
jgi:hypothetical protein